MAILLVYGLTDEGTGCNRCEGMRTFANVTAQVELSVERLDLTAYAHKHRYRLRNIHDGDPVPPARRMKPKGDLPAGHWGYVGQDDRQDAIVGRNGYIAFEGEPGRLEICMFFKSNRGVYLAQARILDMGGNVEQMGDGEITGVVPIESIEQALQLISVSKLKPGPPGGRPDNLARAQDTLRTLESSQRGQAV